MRGKREKGCFYGYRPNHGTASIRTVSDRRRKLQHMTIEVLPDPSTTFGKRVRDRLAKETVIWLTTVGADGTPQPNPVWFLWEGEDTILVYNRTDANRVTHVRRAPGSR